MARQSDFESLVAAYASDLYRYALWLSHDVQHAEDLMQETLLRAWRAFESLRDLASAKAWLLTTLRREHYRRKPAVDWVSLDSEEDRALIPDERLAENSALGGTLDETLDVQQRLAALPAAYREVLVLQLLFGYSTDEIAHLLQTTVPAVANRLLRARRALLQELPATGHVVPLRRKPS